MKKTITILACLAILAAYAGAQSASDIKIFAINQGSSAVDVQLGAATVLFQTTSLAPNSASKMTRISKAGNYQVYYKFSSSKVQLTPRNAGGQPLLYTMAAGKTYLIRLQGDNAVDLFEIGEPSKASPIKPDQQLAKICFVNSTPGTLSSVQIGTSTNNNTLVNLKDLPSKEFSNFATINFPAEYGCFWVLPQSKDALTGYLDASGKPIMTSFLENTYWALIVWQDAKMNTPVANLVNITP